MVFSWQEVLATLGMFALIYLAWIDWNKRVGVGIIFGAAALAVAALGREAWPLLACQSIAVIGAVQGQFDYSVTRKLAGNFAVFLVAMFLLFRGELLEVPRDIPMVVGFLALAQGFASGKKLGFFIAGIFIMIWSAWCGIQAFHDPSMSMLSWWWFLTNIGFATASGRGLLVERRRSSSPLTAVEV